MSYLLDKKIKRKKFFKITIYIIVLIILFYFRSSIFNELSYVSHGFFRPVLSLGNNVGEKLGRLQAYFISKNSLYLENLSLQDKLNIDKAKILNYDSMVAENISLKEILERKSKGAVIVLAAILSKPNQSIYDTLIIDAGMVQGVKIGNLVFALGNIPIGRIAETYPNSSKVILFSNAGEKTQVITSDKNAFMEIIGRGGGNFEMTLPRDFILVKGNQVVMPGLNSYVLAITETIISDPRNPFTKVLLTSPVNIQELKLVQVEISVQ